MIKKRAIIMLMSILLSLPVAVSAAEEKVGPDIAQYNLEDNLLFGLTEEDIYCSAGNFDEAVSLGTRECLNDGTFSFMTGTATRWNVTVTEAKGAYTTVNLGGYKTFDKFIMSTGLDKGVFREASYNLYDFSIYYWDDFQWVKIPIAIDVDTNSSLVRIDFPAVTSCKFKLESNQSTAFRVQEMILFEPGVELVEGTFRVHREKPADYEEIIISGRNYQRDEFITERTYKREDNKVLYRPDMWTTFVSSKEADNIFEIEKVHNNADESVDFIYNGKTINFKAGRKSYIKDGKEVEMKVAPYAEGSMIFVPIRDLIHALGYYMSWNDDTGAIRIYDPRDMLLPTTRDLDYMPEKGVYSPYTVEINGEEQIVWGACNNDFVQHECANAEEEVEVKVTFNKAINTAEILPTSRGLSGDINGNTFTFRAKAGDYLMVELNGDYNRPLFLFLEVPVEKPEADENTIILDQDDVYEFQNIELHDNMTVYIGPGVVLMSTIWIQDVENVKVIGNGIIISPPGSTNFEGYMSKDIVLDGFILPQYGGWKLDMSDCDNMVMRNIKEFSTAVGGDGFDPRACDNLVVDHFFTKLRDDAVAIKAGVKKYDWYHPGINVIDPVTGKGEKTYADMDNVLVQNSTYIAMRTGNPLEIGFELNGEGTLSNFTFRNIDIIRKGDDERGPNWRGGMTIHHSGNANLENITYDDIRVERCDEGFICVGYFYVGSYLHAQKPPAGLSIKNLTYKNISYTGEAPAPSWFFTSMRDSNSDANGGRTGWGIKYDETDPDYTLKIENVVLDNVTYQGRHVDSRKTAEECNFYIDPDVDIKFK